MINLELAKERGLSDAAVFHIEYLHDKRKEYTDKLKDLTKTKLKQPSKMVAIVENQIAEAQAYYSKLLERLERELQRLWGFDTNAKYTKFWELPDCTCPKLDNADLTYPQAIYSLACPLHKHHNGDEVSNESM